MKPADGAGIRNQNSLTLRFFSVLSPLIQFSISDHSGSKAVTPTNGCPFLTSVPLCLETSLNPHPEHWVGEFIFWGATCEDSGTEFVVEECT